MLHLRAVFLALCSAAFAGLDAGAELCAGKLEIGPREAGYYPAGDKADVGAIGAIANAPDHVANVLLAEAGVSAGVARFGTGIRGDDALDDGGDDHL